MGNPYPATFIDQNAEGRLVGELDFTDPANRPGGGITPVTCVLEAFPLNIHGSVPCKWTALFANPKSFAPLAALPVGLGLAVAFDGSDETITTTDAGVWAFTAGLNAALDATWVGSLLLDGAVYQTVQSGPPRGGAVGDTNLAISEVVNVPAGYVLRPAVLTYIASTASPLDADVYLNIVRLA